MVDAADPDPVPLVPTVLGPPIPLTPDEFLELVHDALLDTVAAVRWT
jgi:hypothetical protein